MFNKNKKEKSRKYPEGHFVGIWMAIGIAIFSGLGIPVSMATRNSGLIGIGPAIGVAVGLSIGSAIEEKYKKEGRIRPLNKKEKKQKKLAVIIAVILLLLGALAFAGFFFLIK